MTAPAIYSLTEWLNAVGTETGRSGVIHIDQTRINAFADVSEDWQGIHVDPEVAARGPFGATIAHGFLIVSLLSPMAISALPGHPDDAMVINRGFDKLRFVTPVPVDSDVRAVFHLAEAEQKGNAVRLAHDVTVEIADSGKPALVARWLTMIQYGETP